MPWVHCGHPAIPDDQVCPTCKRNKDAWTVRMGRTRTFALSAPYDGDAEGQADTLKRAAASGAPFCEKCEQAKRELEARGQG